MGYHLIIKQVMFEALIFQSCSTGAPWVKNFSLQMPLASRCQKHNAQAYHHLVCEQHFFLRTLCLADFTVKEDKKRKKLKKLLCESAANLAELFARSVLDTNSISPYLRLFMMHFLSEFSVSQHTPIQVTCPSPEMVVFGPGTVLSYYDEFSLI